MSDDIEEKYQAGKALLIAGDAAAARREITQALRAAPSNAKLVWLSAHIFAREGRAGDALAAFQSAIDLAPQNSGYWQDFSKCLHEARSFKVDAALARKMIQAIARDDIDNTGARLAVQSILTNTFATLAVTGTPPSWAALATLEEEAGSPPVRSLLLAFLEHDHTRTAKLESFLTYLRRQLLKETARMSPTAEMPVDMAAAFALHCFNNEYVFSESSAESAAIAKLGESLAAGMENRRMLRFCAAVYGAYRPLTDEAWADRAAAAGDEPADDLFARFLRVHVVEPRREKELARTITRVTPINDRVSQEVRQQYEENPYPRWQRPQGGRGPAGSVLPRSPTRRHLVAGCGTGHQPLLTALMEPESEIWAMDLSRRSLAYGMRKAEEYGIGNVKFVQGDILELDALPEIFDDISCGGVLHHLADPALGLAALRGRLADTGTLKLAVYTESGRTPVVAGIALREMLNLSATPADIRRFREVVFQLPKGHPAARLGTSTDFFLMSNCRDLVFHVQEHRFTLPQLEAMYTRAGFILSRFDTKPSTIAWFKQRFPDKDPHADLAKWAEIEEERPGLFGSLYYVDLRKA